MSSGNEQSQEEFTQLLQYIYQNNGIGLVLAPPLLGTSSRVKLAIENLVSSLAKPMNPILTSATAANETKAANEWQAALLKYKTVENPRISQQSNTNIQDCKPVYIDLRSIQTRSEILLTIAMALGMESFPKLETLQEEFYYDLRSGNVCTLLILDHVSKIAAKFVYELFSSLLETIGIIIIAEFYLDLNLIWQEQKALPPPPPSTPMSLIGTSNSAVENKFDETIVAKAFLKEIQDFSTLLSLYFEDTIDSLTTNSAIGNSNSVDAKRILVYSSTLSFRETFAVLKTLQPKTPSTTSSSQKLDEVGNSVPPPSAVTPTPPISPKTDLILDIAKGIPGLILITHSLNSKMLRSIQEIMGKIFRSNNILSIKQIINKYVLAGRAYSTIFNVYFEILKALSTLITPQSFHAIQQIIRLYIKSLDTKSIKRTKSLGNESYDDEEDDDVLEEEMERLNTPNYFLKKESSVISHLKLMKKDLLSIGITEDDLVLLQELQLLLPLHNSQAKNYPDSKAGSLKSSWSGSKESKIASSARTLDFVTTSDVSTTDDFQLFSIPVYLLELMKLLWEDTLQSTPVKPPPVPTSLSLAPSESKHFLTDGILSKHLQFLLYLFQEYSTLQLLFTIPELQKYKCVNESMILLKYQLSDIFLIFHQLVSLVFPTINAVSLHAESSSQSPSMFCTTILSKLLSKNTPFANPLLVFSDASNVTKDNLSLLMIEGNQEEERVMLVVAFSILSFGEEMLEMWYPLQENIVFITIITKIILRWKTKDLQKLVQHPFMKDLLTSTFSDSDRISIYEEKDYLLAYSSLIIHASETIFQLWKTYYWSNSWISSTNKNPNGNLSGSGSFAGNDILYSSINDLVLGSLEKLLSLHSSLMDQIQRFITLPSIVSFSKSDDAEVPPNVSRSTSGSIHATASLSYQYYYLQCKQIALYNDVANIQSITKQLNVGRRSMMSISDIFPTVLSEISRNTSQNILLLQRAIESFQKNYYNLSKLQMKIYLQDIINKLTEIMQQQNLHRSASADETVISENAFPSYSSDEWLKQRIYIIKIFESIAQTYLSSGFLLFSLVFRYFPAIAKQISGELAFSTESRGLASINVACKDMMPLIYSYHQNYLCTFQDKLLFYQSLQQRMEQKRQEKLLEREESVFYPTDDDFNHQRHQKEAAENKSNDEATSIPSEIDELVTSTEELYFTKEEQKFRKQIELKQSIFQFIIQYFTQTIEEYSNIYGHDCMLATKCIVYLSSIHQIEYQLFNAKERELLSTYYDKVLIENRNNCDLSLFHYRKLLLSSSSSVAVAPASSPVKTNPSLKVFPFSPRRVPNSLDGQSAEIEQAVNFHMNHNLNEIKFMYSLLHYLLGKYNLNILNNEIIKARIQKKKFPQHIQETQHYISLALFQTGYETLLSIQRNDAGNALLMNLMTAQLELLGKTDKLDLFQQIMFYIVDSLNYERQYLQEKLVSTLQGILFSASSATINHGGPDEFDSVAGSASATRNSAIFFSPGSAAQSHTISFIDSTIRATIRSGIELAYTLQQLLHQCAVLYEERELFQQASLIHKELLYMYRDLHTLLSLDALELFPVISAEYDNQTKRRTRRFSQAQAEEEELALLERLSEMMNQSVYNELAKLFEEISLQFTAIDMSIANTLFDLGRSLCYYHLDPTIFATQANSTGTSPSAKTVNPLFSTTNPQLYYHKLYQYHSLSHKIPTYYLLKDDRSTANYLQYFQAIRALTKSKYLYHRLYEENDQLLARQYLKIYRELGLLYAEKKEFAKAKHCHQVLQKLFLSVPGFLSILEIGDLQVEYGNILLHLNEFFEANILFQQSVDYYRQYYVEQITATPLSFLSLRKKEEQSKLPTEDTAAPIQERTLDDSDRFNSREEKILFQFIQKKLIIAYLGKSSALLEDNDYESAQKSVEYCIELIYEYFNRKDDIYLIEITLAYMILASIHHYYHEFDEALELYRKIEKVYVHLHMTETVEMAKLYHNQAIIFDDLGKQQEAKLFYEKAVVLLIQRHSTQFQQLLTTLEGLHALLLDMNLREEADSIERYAEDVQLRIIKYDQEEQLRVQTLQKSLKTQNQWLSTAEEWSYRQRRVVAKASPVTVATGVVGTGAARSSSPTSNNSSPNISQQFRKRFVPSTAAGEKFKNLHVDTSLGETVDEGPGTSTSVNAPDPSAVLKKSDSFKKKLKASYYLKHKQSPSNKTLTPRSLRQVVIMDNKSDSGTSNHPQEEEDIEGFGTFVDSPTSLSSTSRPVSAVGPGKPSMFKRSFQTHSKVQTEKTIHSAPPSTVHAAKSSFDIHRIFSDGLLFTSLDEKEITSSPSGNAYPTSDNRRTASEDRDDMLEQGGPARRGSGNSSSGVGGFPMHQVSPQRDFVTYDEEGEAYTNDLRDEEDNGEEEEEEEDRDKNLPSGNCVIQ